MNSNSIFTVLSCLLLSCSNQQRTICSPDKTQCLTLEHAAASGEAQGRLLVYYGKPPITKREYASIGWPNNFGIDVYWGTQPLKIRCITPIVKNNIPADQVDIQNYKREDEMTNAKGSFQSYDLPSLINSN